MTSRNLFCISYLFLAIITIFALVRYHSCGKACLSMIHLCFSVLATHGSIGALKWGSPEGAYPLVESVHTVTTVLVPLLAIPSSVVHAIPKRICGKRELAMALGILQFMPSTIYFIKLDNVDTLVIEIEVLTNILTLTGLGIHYKDFYLFGSCIFYALGHYSGKCQNMLVPLEDELCLTYGLCGFTVMMLTYVLGACSPFKI